MGPQLWGHAPADSQEAWGCSINVYQSACSGKAKGSSNSRRERRVRCQ